MTEVARTDPARARSRLDVSRPLVMLCMLVLGLGSPVTAQMAGPGPQAPAQSGVSMWDDTVVPAVPSSGEPLALEIGVQLTSDIPGFITHLRFYKGAGNTGTHVGSLWTLDGTLLGQATFPNETPTGWQQGALGAPVAIEAGTVYVASCHLPDGNYAFDVAYFATSGVSNPPLTFLSDAAAGGNGVFEYGPSPSFPQSRFGATNYWVDIVFSETAGPDVTPPAVTNVYPADGSADPAIGVTATATFSEPMDPSTLTPATVFLLDESAQPVKATIAYDEATRTVFVTPAAALTELSTYSLAVVGGVDGAADLAGNVLAADRVWSFTTAADPTACQSPATKIVEENCRAGNPTSQWEVIGAGDATIQGFATEMSVDAGQTVTFKVDTDSQDYRLDIYRLGYYQGLGARKVATVLPTAPLPQSQPSCLSDPASGLIDCGNWAVSAAWSVPADAVSGIYVARLVRSDTGGASHIIFVVRDDDGASDLLFQTSDTTWQAYNDYGGNSLYSGSPAGRAYKVSYNRPFVTRGNQYSRAWLFGAEYPMVRWLEANGYSVSYASGIDTDRMGSALLGHRAFLSVGHDEYWSADQRANVEAARAAGVHLAFFSGNEIFWKTRWENSIDASQTSYRTLVSYKETLADAKIDPLPDVWTGTWRDPRFSPPADGGRPENELTGTIFKGNCCAALPLTVSAEQGQLRFWRNTGLDSITGPSVELAPGIVGYEFDADLENGFRPPGLARMSTSTFEWGSTLLDFGSEFGPGEIVHALTLYKHASGSWVFGAGTIRWSWALDVNHDEDSATPNVLPSPDPIIQQATVNLLADLGAQPATLQPGLVGASASTDFTSPVSDIEAPMNGSVLVIGDPVTISGTAVDAAGAVAAVEVSVDSGSTWQAATGTNSWSFLWDPAIPGLATVLSRAVDDSGNIEQPAGGTIEVFVPEPSFLSMCAAGTLLFGGLARRKERYSSRRRGL